MNWNDLVSSVREKLRRGLGLPNGQEIQVAAQVPSLEQLGTTPLSSPSVDVYENDREILIHADVPGGSPDGAAVSWDEGRGLTLLIKNQAPPSGVPWASEYEPHDWFRTFELPDYVDGLKATSSLKDGVLIVRIPKRSAVAKLIPVKPA
jgi:HSP20 family molecular chaperone IbpA